MRALRILTTLFLALLTSATHVSRADPARSGITVTVRSLLTLAAPEPLSAAEEADPGLLALARRFNPAMALPIREVWPVEVRYAWHDGGDLVARDEDGREAVAVPSPALASRDWSGLPATDAQGRRLRYYLDAPGDDRVGESGRSRWRERFAAIAQPGGDAAPATASPYPPTQYLHAYWWNRARGLLALQFWFYYPFNEWVNHHEGDWEHIEILLEGADHVAADAPFRPVAHHFFFHDFWLRAREVNRFAGPDPRDDHPLVHVGGTSEWFGFAGQFSGGSYPAAARFEASAFPLGWLSPDEDTRAPVRFLAAEEFQLVLLPEPERLDGARTPALSWLRLPFYLGQRRVTSNPPGVDESCGRPPLQPAARAEWRGPPPYQEWRGRSVRAAGRASSQPWPAHWRRLAHADARDH